MRSLSFVLRHVGFFVTSHLHTLRGVIHHYFSVAGYINILIHFIGRRIQFFTHLCFFIHSPIMGLTKERCK